MAGQKPPVVTPTPTEDVAITVMAARDADNPILTESMLAQARALDGFPELAALVRRNARGRPPLAASDRKERVTLHLDPDVLAALRRDGRGWQTRANAALRRALGLQG